MLAAQLGLFDIVSFIAKNIKINLNDKVNCGHALLYAVQKNQIEVVRTLIKAGALKHRVTSDSKNNAVHLAIMNKNIEMVKLLIENDFDHLPLCDLQIMPSIPTSSNLPEGENNTYVCAEAEVESLSSIKNNDYPFTIIPEGEKFADFTGYSLSSNRIFLCAPGFVQRKYEGVWVNKIKIYCEAYNIKGLSYQLFKLLAIRANSEFYYIDKREKNAIITPLDFLKNKSILTLPLPGWAISPMANISNFSPKELQQITSHTGHSIEGVKNLFNYTPIALAATMGLFDIVKLMAENRKTDPEDKANYREALLAAVIAGKIEAVRSLIRAEASRDCKTDQDNNYALHMAVINNDFKMLELLMRKGFDSTQKNGEGLTPYQLAAKSGNFEIVNLIDQYQDSRKCINDFKEIYSTSKEKSRILEYLILNKKILPHILVSLDNNQSNNSLLLKKQFPTMI